MTTQQTWKVWVKLGITEQGDFIEDLTIYDSAEKPGYVRGTVIIDDPLPEWQPQASAIGLPDGTARHGSTGQLWVAMADAWERAVNITINGDERVAPKKITYEKLVELAGKTGFPSMTVCFGDRERAGRAPHRGQTIELDEGAIVDVVHTGSA